MRRAYPITLLALLGAVLALNSSVDLAGTGQRSRIGGLSARQKPDEILVAETDIDQRAWVRGRLQASCPETLVFGSSTIGGLSAEMMADTALLNAWMTGPMIEDYEAVFTLLEDARCRPRRVIMGIDPWLLDRSQRNDRWKTLHWELVRYRGSEVALSELFGPALLAWATLKERLAFTTTLESARWALRRLRSGRPRHSGAPKLIAAPVDTACKEAQAELRVRYADGHFVGCPRFALEPAAVEAVARAYAENDPHGVVACTALDAATLTRLRRLVERHRARGSAVLLLTPPYHPLSLRALRAIPVVAQRLDALDEQLTAIARATGARLIPLRDPAELACAPSEFSDSHHAAPACLEKEATRIRALFALP